MYKTIASFTNSGSEILPSELSDTVTQHSIGSISQFALHGNKMLSLPCEPNIAQFYHINESSYCRISAPEFVKPSVVIVAIATISVTSSYLDDFSPIPQILFLKAILFTQVLSLMIFRFYFHIRIRQGKFRSVQFVDKQLFCNQEAKFMIIPPYQR